MDSIVQAILNHSKLEVTHIKITEATKTDFVMEITSRVTDTGPVGATMAPMIVDIIGPGGAFGKLQLPEVKTSSKGTDVHIDPQKIAITNYDAFKAFVKAIIQQDKLVLKLDNGEGTIKALGMKSKITYKKDIELVGMNGPKARITKAGGSKDDLRIDLQVFNPSPLEIDLGTAMYEVTDGAGAKVAEVQGSQHVTRGGSNHVLSGKVTGAPAAGAAKLVGTGAKEDTWAQETNKFLVMNVQISADFAALS